MNLGRRNGYKLSVREIVELEGRQKEYQKLTGDYATEVLSLLGGVDGDRKLERRAIMELSQSVADAVAGFIMRHS
jgi:hypothetical protein